MKDRTAPSEALKRFHKLLPLACAITMIAVATGCRHHHPVAHVPGGTPAPQPPEKTQPPIVQGEEGIASWYGHPFDGRRTASGEIYDMHAMTAAHRTLPFGTRVRVHDLENNESVVVRINDRGPFIPGRIIDLSYAAAQKMHMPGTALVRLQVLNVPSQEPTELYTVQVGAFTDRENAERLKRRIERKFGPVMITTDGHGRRVLHRVLVGKKATEGQAQTLADDLLNAKLAGEAMVVRLN